MKNKRVREKIGFTLAELLIVVAIIAVLAAIAIPVFTNQLNKSKYQADVANARSIYSELSADYLARGGKSQARDDSAKKGVKITAKSGGAAITAPITAAGDYTLYVDSETNDYTFSGLSTVTITLGTDTAKPSVSIAPPTGKDYGEAKTFGQSSSSGS